MYKLPEMGGGGVIWAMPERKHSFFKEVFPNSDRSSFYVMMLILLAVSKIHN